MSISVRPWGSFTTYAKNADGVTVKTIQVNPDSRLSLQSHHSRSEEWFLLRGDAYAVLGSREHLLTRGMGFKIPVGAKHRLGSRKGAEILEIAIGAFDEDDIVRFEDDYNRA